MAEQNPLAKYELRRTGGSARNTEGMFTNDNGNAARDARRAAKREARPMTYAEMQQAGIARPAPQMPTQAMSQPSPVAQMFTGQEEQSFYPEDYGTPTIPGWSGRVDIPNLPPGLFPGATPPPSPPTSPTAPPAPGLPGLPPGFSPNSDIYNRQREAALANLRAQFASNRRSLEEDMARRGLSASSVGADRLADLFGQQERTQASLEAQLLADEDARRREYLDLYLRMLPVIAQGRR